VAPVSPVRGGGGISVDILGQSFSTAPCQAKPCESQHLSACTGRAFSISLYQLKVRTKRPCNLLSNELL
jgi:hypothetical protein